MKYLIGIIIGAIIGYLTNWLAIKMLFRPYNEIRFLGFKIPFTPGLIPKEKERIAKSVGNAVGEHLLDTNTIMDSLCNEKVNKSISKYIFIKIESLIISDKKIKDVLSHILGSEYKNFIKSINNKSTELITKNVASEEMKCNITNIIYRNCKGICNLQTNSIINSDVYNNLKQSIKTYGIDYLKSDDLKLKLKGAMISKLDNVSNSNKKLYEIVPENIIKAIKIYICENKYEISKYLNDILKSEKSEIKIKEITNDTISELSPMIAMFIKGDIIYNKIISKGDELLSKEENVDEIVIIINEAIDNFMNKNFKDIIENMASDIKEECVESLIDFMVLQISQGEIENLIEEVLEPELLKSQDLNGLFNKFNMDCENLMLDTISKLINKVSDSEKTKEVIKDIISDATEKIINMELKPFVESMSNDKKEKISNVAIDTYNKFMKTSGKEFVGNFKVDQIIEDKINSFDVEFAEKLILDIASKELRAITWLGALLGGIMGILSPILGSI